MVVDLCAPDGLDALPGGRQTGPRLAAVDTDAHRRVAGRIQTHAGGDFGQEVDLLAKIPLFAGMERSKLKLLAFTSERQDFEKGQVLFNQGDPGDRAFVIVEGAVDVIVDTPDGPQVLSNPGRGDVIGELALLCEEPRTATVKANQPLTVLSISSDVFFRLIQENPDVSVALTRIVAKRLIQTMKQMG